MDLPNGTCMDHAKVGDHNATCDVLNQDPRGKIEKVGNYLASI